MTAETINQAIQMVHADPEYKKILRNYLYKQNRTYLMNDLYQDLMLILLDSKSPLEIIRMHNNRQLIYWWESICRRNVESATSPFYYRYVKYSPSMMQDAPDVEETKRDINELIDLNDNFKSLNTFLSMQELKSKKHKVAAVCFRHYYLDQLTYQEIENKYKNGDAKMSIHKVHSSVKFMEELIRQNIDEIWNK